MSENKLSKKYIGTNQVGANQLELENNSSVRSKSFDGLSDISLLKLDAAGLLQIEQQPFLPGDATEPLQASSKQQVALLDGTQTMTADLPFIANKGPSSSNEEDGMIKSFSANNNNFICSSTQPIDELFGASAGMSVFSQSADNGATGQASVGVSATSLDYYGSASVSASAGSATIGVTAGVVATEEYDSTTISTKEILSSSSDQSGAGLWSNSFQLYRFFNNVDDQAVAIGLSTISTDICDNSVSGGASTLGSYFNIAANGDGVFSNISILLNGLPSMPLQADHVAVKAYVDQEVLVVSSALAGISSTVDILVSDVSTLQSDVSDLIAADIALDGRLDTAESNITTLQGQMSTANSNISTLQGQVIALQTYAENIVHIDGTNGTDAVGRGSIMQPYKTITYAYSQVPSAASNINQWCLEKLILKVAPGDYTENVELGLKRARTAIMGEGVYINGTVTQTWLVADIPYSGTPGAPINGASLPAPYTNFAAPTFELIGFGGGMEGGYVSKNLMVQGLVKIATIPWATNSSWQSAGTLSAFFFTTHVQLRSGFNVCHDIATYPASVGAAVTCEINSSSIEGGYLGVAPFTAGQQLTALDVNCVCNLKAHNSQLKSTLGPRISIAEIDGCRIVNMDRTMGATVTNGSITGQNSSSFSGIVNSPFAGSVYKIGRSVGVTAVAFKMDANSYADLQSKTIDSGTAPITYNLIDKASGVAVVDPATNYTRTANNVESSLEGIDVALGTYLLLSGTRTMTGALNMGSFKIGSLANPTLAQDAATKAYVDAQLIAGVDFEIQKVVLSGTDITNQYIDLSFKAALASITASSERINLITTLSADSDADFIQNNTGAVTRLAFQGDSATGGASPLDVGQIIFFNYVKAI